MDFGTDVYVSPSDCTHLFACNCVTSSIQNCQETVRNIFLPCTGISVLLQKLTAYQMFNRVNKNHPDSDEINKAHEEYLASERIFSLETGGIGLGFVLCWIGAFAATWFRPDDAGIWWFIMQYGLYALPFIVFSFYIIFELGSTAKEEYAQNALINWCCLFWPCCQPCYVTYLTEDINQGLGEFEREFGLEKNESVYLPHQNSMHTPTSYTQSYDPALGPRELYPPYGQNGLYGHYAV